MVWTAFCGSRNGKEKTETDIRQWNKKIKAGENFGFFFLRGSLFLPWTVFFFLKALGAAGGTGHGLQHWTTRGYRHTSRMWFMSRIQWPWYCLRLLASYFVESLSTCISLIFPHDSHIRDINHQWCCDPCACIRRQRMLHTHRDIYKFFFIFFSLTGYYKILSRAPCTTQ